MADQFPTQEQAMDIILTQHAIHDAGVEGNVTSAESLPLGRSRINYKVQFEGQEKAAVVSFYNHQNHNFTPAYQAKMQKELEESGVKVPKMLGYRQGKDGQYPALISEFVEGKYSQTLSEAQLKTAADTIAEFHATEVSTPSEADRNPKKEGVKTRNNAIEGYMERLNAAQKVPNSVTQKAMIQFKKNTENKERNLPRGLVHSDLRPENFIFSEDDQSMTLLDLERAKPNGELLFDLATFISKSIVISELQHETPPKHEEKIKAFLESYHEKCPLTPAELDALPEYIESRTFYTTALRSGLKESKPDLYIDVDKGIEIQAGLQDYLAKTNFKEMLGVKEQDKSAGPMQYINTASVHENQLFI